MKNKSLNRILITFIALLALVLSACSQTASPKVENEFINNAETVASYNELSTDGLLSELTTPTGSTLSFIDESLAIEGAGIGIIEVGKTFSMAGLEQYKPTALELFLTFSAEHSKVPQQLIDSHAQLAIIRNDISVEPRVFKSELKTQGGGFVGSLDLEYCRDSSTFETKFHTTIFDFFGFAYEGYGLGIIWKNYGVTGQSNRRALAACNNPLHTTLASSTPVRVHIEAQLGANLWPLVPGTARTLDNGEGMYYFSEGWTSQRYRIVANAHPWAIYNLAGAWGAKSPYKH